MLVAQTDASGADLHWLWDDRCAECHGHSAEFARQFLQLNGNQLQGRHPGRDLRLFLRNHYSPQAEVDGIYHMLKAQVNSSAHYRVKCRGCHGNAAEFVRTTLLVKEGVLQGRASRRPVAAFMRNHRNLDSEEIEFFVKLLQRVAIEVDIN